MRRLRARSILATRLFSFSAMLGLAVIAPATAVAQTTTFTESFSVPVTPSYVSCGGEVVELSGRVHVLLHSTIDAAGGVHAVSKENTQGVRGVGLTTGARYVLVDTKQGDHFNGRPGGASELTIERTFLLVAQGTLEDARVHVIAHTTVNANGEPTAVVFEVVSECRG